MRIKCAYIFMLCIFQLTKIVGQISLGFDEVEWPDTLWSGEVHNFTLSDGYLQLLDPEPEGSNTSYIYLEAPTSSDSITYWYFDWRMDFSPSASNYSRIWLACDVVNDEITSGYYLRMGGVSGSSDALKLIYFDGFTDLDLGSSSAGYMHGDEVHKRIQVQRDTTGEWAVFGSDPAVDEYDLLFTAIHNPTKQFEYVLLECIYTVSRNEHFFMDSFYLDPIYTDLKPPTLVEWNYVPERAIEFLFDESIESSVPSFMLNSNIYEPDYSIEDNSLFIFMEDNIEDGVFFDLAIEGIRDEHLNVAPVINISGNFKDIRTASPGDIIINEILFEPSVSENPLCPVFEFIEIYNTSAYDLDVSELALEYNGMRYHLNINVLARETYLVISSDPDLVGGHYLEDFPSLLNSGATLGLSSKEILIDKVFYSPTHYKDPDRDNGGYSLERINYFNPCLGEENWSACQFVQGVSPGYPNSVLDTNFYPVIQVDFIDIGEGKQSVILESNHLLSESIAETIFAIEPNNTIIAGYNFFDTSQKIELIAEEVLLDGMVYNFSISDSILLCNETLEYLESYIEFGKGRRPNYGELVINEILPDPAGSCSQYIELRNTTSDLLDGEDLFIGLKSLGDEFIFPLSVPLIAPDDFPVFVRDSVGISSCYAAIDKKHIWVPDLFKSINKDSFRLSLYRRNPDFTTTSISEMEYNVMARGGETYAAGIAYERLLDGNWLSASAPDFGSPTAPNKDIVMENFPLNQPFYLNPPLLEGSSKFVNLAFELGTEVAKYTISVCAFGIPRFYELVDGLQLSGSGNYFIEQFPWDVMKRGTYLMVIEREIDGLAYDRWLLPFFVYL